MQGWIKHHRQHVPSLENWFLFLTNSYMGLTLGLCNIPKFSNTEVSFYDIVMNVSIPSRVHNKKLYIERRVSNFQYGRQTHCVKL